MQQTKNELITAHIAGATLWHFTGAGNHGGTAHRPSEWRRLLIQLIEASDPENRARLALAYEGQVAAVTLAERPGGLAILRALATSWSTPGRDPEVVPR